MNQDLVFETLPFEIDLEFQDEEFELDSEKGKHRPFGNSKILRSRPRFRPGGQPKISKRPPVRPRPIPRGPRRPWAVIREPYGLADEPYPVETVPSSGSERVRWAQDCLNQAMGLQLSVTGIMGRETRSAVRSFQKQQGLRASGIMGPDTEEALKIVCSRQSARMQDTGNSSEEEELGPVTATVNWLVNDKSTGSASKNLFSVSEAAKQKGVGGVYILTGYLKSDPARRNRILKVGSASDFSNRFGNKGYSRKEFSNLYGNVQAYLGLIKGAKSPTEQVERALARLFYRAGEELPADRKPPEQGPVTGRVKVRNIVPPDFLGKLHQAYRASGTEVRKTKSGGRRSITARQAGTPLPTTPGLLVLDAFPQWEVNHTKNYTCPKCRMSGEEEQDALELPNFGEIDGQTGLESPFSEIEEIELATELLSISSEEELDQFLGKLVKRAWRGVKNVGRVVGKIAKPLGGVLKGVAKAALPIVGGALGSFIPIPGVGTAVGSALGGALSKALELELGELEAEEQELEVARRVVRIAGTAARQAALAGPGTDPQIVAKNALVAAAHRHVQNFPANVAGSTAGDAQTGIWIRRGRTIVLQGI